MVMRPLGAGLGFIGAFRVGFHVFAATTALLLTLALAACGGGGPAPTCNPSGTQLRITVKETTHNFDKECLAAPMNQAFTIEFENHDPSLGGNHNIHIFDGGTLFVGDFARHGTSITYEVGPLHAGTFRFQCDNHAAAMNGTFIVK